METRCYVWTDGRKSQPYGVFTVGPRRNREYWLAHRFAWKFIYKLPLRKKDCLLHKCDFPGCVRRSHLFTGSRPDNTRDMMAKNRHWTTKGEERNQRKLNECDVVAIREAYKKGNTSHRKLASVYGVSHAVIGNIIRREDWQHVN